MDITQRLCYRYYPSKEEIYDAALEKYAAFATVAFSTLYSRKYGEGPRRSGCRTACKDFHCYQVFDLVQKLKVYCTKLIFDIYHV